MKKLLYIAVLLLASCGNPYVQFYQGIPDARVRPGYERTQKALQIYRTDNLDRDVQELLRRGYSLIGLSCFNAASNSVSEMQIREQATKIGAHVVLVASKYSHTISGVIPMTIPRTTTSYSSGSATAYGFGSVVNAYGSGTTTTYGSQTVMIPYSVMRSDFTTLLFAKTKVRLGIVPSPIDDDTRRRLQTNAGIKVLVVVTGSPAFLADVLPGDIVLSIGDNLIQSLEHFGRLLDRYQGQKALFKINRNGMPVEKEIEILSYSAQVNESSSKEGSSSWVGSGKWPKTNAKKNEPW